MVSIRRDFIIENVKDFVLQDVIMDVIPYKSQIQITFDVGISANTEVFFRYSYPNGILAISYLEISTPAGVEGNIYVKSFYDKERKLLATNVAENTASYVIDLTNYTKPLYVKELILYGKTLVDITSPTTVTLYYGGVVYPYPRKTHTLKTGIIQRKNKSYRLSLYSNGQLIERKDVINVPKDVYVEYTFTKSITEFDIEEKVAVLI